MFKNLLKKQPSNIIEWNQSIQSNLLYKVEVNANEIKGINKLVIQPNQGCMLINSGKVKSILNEPGTYTLKTNHSFIASLLELHQKSKEDSIALCFFYNAELTNLLWETPIPVKYTIPNVEFPIELNAYGSFSIKIINPQVFYEHFLGYKKTYTTKDAQQLLTTHIIPELASYLTINKYAYQTLSTNLSGVSNELKSILNATFEKVGLLLTSLHIEALPFTEETKDHIQQTSQEIAATSLSPFGKVPPITSGLSLTESSAKESLINQTIEPKTDTIEALIDQLRKLKVSFDAGEVTEEAFNAQKQEILSKI